MEEEEWYKVQMTIAEVQCSQKSIKRASISVMQLTLSLKLVTLEDQSSEQNIARPFLFIRRHCAVILSLAYIFFPLITSPSTFHPFSRANILTINSYLATGCVISKSGVKRQPCNVKKALII